MNRQEHFRQVKLRNAVELKNKVDTAFELYSTMTEEEHGIITQFYFIINTLHFVTFL